MRLTELRSLARRRPAEERRSHVTSCAGGAERGGPTRCEVQLCLGRQGQDGEATQGERLSGS